LGRCELRVLVGTEKQHGFAAQALQRIYRVARMPGRELALVDLVAWLALDGEPEHGDAMSGGSARGIAVTRGTGR
jgi:hypothetical protein